MNLAELPIDHKLRNTPLGQINAFYRQAGTKTYFEVFPSFNIAKKTFNQLGEVWTNNQEWIADEKTNNIL